MSAEKKKKTILSTEMSFAAHLQELRWCLLKSIIAVFIRAAICYSFWRPILSFFTSYPLSKAPMMPDLVYLDPTEAFLVSVKIALFGGIVLSIPFVFYQVWKFIAPGLFSNEKNFVLPVVLFSTFFFISGAGFAYFLVIPLAFRFLMGFNTEKLMPMFSINNYIGFILKILIAFALTFELPVFSFILTRMGLLTSSFLIKSFKYAVIIIFIMAALLTPPDVFTQILMAIPLVFLYSLSIGISYLVEKKHA